MKKRCLPICALLLILLFCSVLLSGIAYADVGQKSSVVIRFSGLENVDYYVTLLSQTDTTGPYSALTDQYTKAYYRPGNLNYDIYQRFLHYRDQDGFYFLQYFGKCSNNESFQWSYYPPTVFKILIYLPASNTFAVSEPYERYAFESYYRATVANSAGEAAAANLTIRAEKDYDFQSEFLSLLLRISITILVKIGIAFLFHYQTKLHLRILLLTSLLTQTSLNLLLNLVHYHWGHVAFLLAFVFLGVFVFAIEATAYCFLFRYYQRKHGLLPGSPVLYALTANAASFISGFWLSYLLPGIF
ncbi:MAG: hypothetical protein LLG09_04790 [Negativicutes bacterium]|nr:hypothetical protein [Negativicutes bacterium]